MSTYISSDLIEGFIKLRKAVILTVITITTGFRLK